MEEKNDVSKKTSVTKTVVRITILLILAVIIAAAAVFAATTSKRNKTYSIARAMTAEELNELSIYPNLQELDLHGSTCYEAIAEYESSHPNVRVLYSVNVDGAEIENTSANIDWFNRSPEALIESAALIPWIRSISLGETDASFAVLNELRDSFPDAELSYSLSFKGRSFDSSATSADLTTITSSDLADASELIVRLPKLQYVKLSDSSSFDIDSYIELYNARPDINYDYSFGLYGQDFTTDSSEMIFKQVEIGNDGAQELNRIISCLPRLELLKIDRCDIDDEIMAEIRDSHPDKNIIWRVFFWKFGVFTDVESIWAIGGLEDKHTEALKYCTEVKYLDLGHNDLIDVGFLRYMPKLEVLILSLSYSLEDISPLMSCPELEYLELTLTRVSDLSPLSGLTKLRHLELSQCFWLTDITPIMNLELDRLHIMYSGGIIPEEQFDMYRELHPNCKTDFSSILNPAGQVDPYNVSEWRYLDSGGPAPRYALLREQIGYGQLFNPAEFYDRADAFNQ